MCRWSAKIMRLTRQRMWKRPKIYNLSFTNPNHSLPHLHPVPHKYYSAPCHLHVQSYGQTVHGQVDPIQLISAHLHRTTVIVTVYVYIIIILTLECALSDTLSACAFVSEQN